MEKLNRLFFIFLIINVLFSNYTGGKLFVDKMKGKKCGFLSPEETQELLKADLNKFYSDKKLGSFVENGKTFFRLFAPNAVKV